MLSFRTLQCLWESKLMFPRYVCWAVLCVPEHLHKTTSVVPLKQYEKKKKKKKLKKKNPEKQNKKTLWWEKYYFPKCCYFSKGRNCFLKNEGNNFSVFALFFFFFFFTEMGYFFSKTAILYFNWSCSLHRLWAIGCFLLGETLEQLQRDFSGIMTELLLSKRYIWKRTCSRRRCISVSI